ncbi:MAG: BACON domain-containing protein [Bacteroidales bacterium]|nr:BACON domain-containing protein [Bacteroidales bacterium]
MKKNFSIFFMATWLALCLAGCSQEVLVTQGKSLGTVEVYPAAGDFSVFIDTDGVWSASSPETWVHVPADLFKDAGAIIVGYDSNESVVGAPRFNRLGHVIVRTYDGATADTLYIRQQGIEAFISLEDATVPASGGSCYIPLRTNLTGAQRGSISCSSDAGWIVSPEIGADFRSILFTAESGSSREGMLTVSFTDEWGLVTSAGCKISQREGGQ